MIVLQIMHLTTEAMKIKELPYLNIYINVLVKHNLGIPKLTEMDRAFFQYSTRNVYICKNLGIIFSSGRMTELEIVMEA